ncbi:MAG: FecR domain-containing protein [Pseudomonadota bacterium]
MAEEQDTRDHIDTEAMDWFTLLHSGSIEPGERFAFETWLHADRSHKAAYRKIEQLYRDLDYIGVEAGINLDEALRQEKREPRRGSASGLWTKLPQLAAIAAVALLAFMVMRPDIDTLSARPETSIVTQIGEIRDVALEDGTIVTLGASSEISVEYAETSRLVTLLRGEAFFNVTSDASRPFFVASQDTLVRVIGTQFDVKLGADIVHVAVLEGVVEVMKSEFTSELERQAHPNEDHKQILTAGQRVSAARRVPLPDAKQIEQIVPGAWRKGRLVYEDASLAEIIADMNRYSDLQIQIGSPAVGDFRSTLAFQISEIEAAISAIEAIHPIEIEYGPKGKVVFTRKR